MDVTQQSTVNSETFRNRQEGAQELRKLLTTNKLSLKLKQLPSLIDGILIYCDTTKAIARPFVMKIVKKLIFNNLHSLSHPDANLRLD